MRRLIVSAIILFPSIFSSAQDAEQKSFYDMSLEELMNVEVSVASVKSLPPRESPGIVTLVTEEEITASGATDLMSVLNLIPGFDFGTDVEGVVGLGVRGNWGHEGKVLLLIDGMEMNENLFSSLQFGNHYPVENISRIEIIRGPGSAIYGGYAEFSVINIITRTGKEINGVKTSAHYGQTEKTFSSRSFSLEAGKSGYRKNISFFAYAGQQNRSDRDFTDVFGSSYAMASQSLINALHCNFGFSYKNFSVRALSDYYTLQTRDAYDFILTQPYTIKFPSVMMEVKQKFQISNSAVLSPSVFVKQQVPWSFDKPSAEDEFGRYKIISDKIVLQVPFSWDVNKNISLISGGEAVYENAKNKIELFSASNSEVIDFYSGSLYTQGMIKSKIANITAGARYSFSELYDDAFVPRLCITKLFSPFHIKLLASRAYRIPSIENYNFNTALVPEMTTVLETEAGAQLNEKMNLVLNGYDISTSNPIIYFYDEITEEEGYLNSEKAGTRGVEAEFKFKDKWGFAGINYTFYELKKSGAPSLYTVPGNETSALAFPNHKAGFLFCIHTGKRSKLFTSVNFSGERYAITSLDSTGTAVYESISPASYINMSFTRENAFMSGLNISLMANNLLNNEVYFIQPYASNHAPLPGQSRSFGIKMSYAFNKIK